jgi:hypothetical protein
MILYVYNPFWSSIAEKTEKKYEAGSIKEDEEKEKSRKVVG